MAIRKVARGRALGQRRSGVRTRTKVRARPPRSGVDCRGRPVTVGTKVRMLSVAETLRNRLSPGEWAELQTMVGDVFTVYEIDEHGSAWVEKEWLNKRGHLTYSHAYALEAHEMEVVGPKRARRPTMR